MAQKSNLQLLALAGVAHRCTQETSLYFQRKPYDPRFCFELFRRAIAARDQQAWGLIYSQYRSLVAGWVQHHSSFAGSGEEVQYFVNRTFEKMWAALPPERFRRFPNLKSLLRYLQMCAYSAVVDHARRAERGVIDVEPEAQASGGEMDNPTADEQPLDKLQREELWQEVTARLKDDRERAVVYGCFALALKPRELYARYEELFADVREVYRVKENVLARLGRDAELQRILLGRA